MAPQVLVGSGDIAKCGSQGSELTARLLDATPGTVFTTGDNVYETGTREEYRDCYTPTWGRHRDRTRPSPGNHEYGSPGAAPYYEYFGDAAGPNGAGYYSYHLGSWLILSLNSEASARAGSAQERWVSEQLSAHGGKCSLAYWHRPLFSSGPHGANGDMRDLWRTLYRLGADVVISGHDHLYERFAPQDPDGRPDPKRGVRQFVVGTGGGDLYRPKTSSRNSEALESVWGLLKLTLTDDAYSWQFLPVDGGFRDAGTDQCH
jgi:hypothetical protein